MRQTLVRLGVVDDEKPLELPLFAALVIELVAGLLVFFLLRALGVPFTWPVLVVMLIVVALGTIRRSRR